jgi:hypothetical protein
MKDAALINKCVNFIFHLLHIHLSISTVFNISALLVNAFVIEAYEKSCRMDYLLVCKLGNILLKIQHLASSACTVTFLKIPSIQFYLWK